MVMGYCEKCGAVPEDTDQYCPSCGEPLSMNRDAENRGLENNVQKEEGFIWDAHTPVVTSSIAMKQMVMALGAGILFLAVVLGIMDFGALLSLIPVLLIIFLVLVVIGFIVAVAIQAGTKGGPVATFAVTKEGIGYRAGPVSGAINLATLGGAAVTGSLAGAGGSLINMSREMDFIAWKEMRSVTARTSDRSVVVYRKELISPIAVYCTKENFEPVLSMIRHYAPQGTVSLKRW
jgi:hypothetical protein